jgi:hypothetical protein
MKARSMKAMCALASACMFTLGAVGPVRAQDAALADKPARWQAPATEGWSLAWPAQQAKVRYHGVVSFDNAGTGAGAMVYVGVGGIVGALAHLAVHAAVTEGAKNSQKTQMQEAADKVLTTYAGTIDAFAPADLLARTDSLLRTSKLAPSDAASARWSLEVMPVYRMTQDRRALMVDAVLSVRASASADVVARSAVRVVSAPLVAEDASAAWSQGDGETLRAESARLLSQAVTLALSDLAGQWDAAAPAQRTVRFPEGGEERIERAQVIRQQCGRTVLRTLRGDLMDVPMRTTDGAADAECNAAAAADKALTAPVAAKEN